MSKARVVEGGAMKSIFAAGVLDAFMQDDFRPYDFAIMLVCLLVCESG